MLRPGGFAGPGAAVSRRAWMAARGGNLTHPAPPGGGIAAGRERTGRIADWPESRPTRRRAWPSRVETASLSQGPSTARGTAGTARPLPRRRGHAARPPRPGADAPLRHRGRLGSKPDARGTCLPAIGSAGFHGTVGRPRPARRMTSSGDLAVEGRDVAPVQGRVSVEDPEAARAQGQEAHRIDPLRDADDHGMPVHPSATLDVADSGRRAGRLRAKRSSSKSWPSGWRPLRRDLRKRRVFEITCRGSSSGSSSCGASSCSSASCASSSSSAHCGPCGPG